MQTLNALSLAPAVKDWLVNSHHFRILHVFDHACNLLNERREVLSIVTPEIGNGPFNIVVDKNILFSKHCDVESTITISTKIIGVGDISINIEYAPLWNPRPYWENLHSNISHICNQL